MYMFIPYRRLFLPLKPKSDLKLSLKFHLIRQAHHYSSKEKAKPNPMEFIKGHDPVFCHLDCLAK